MTKFNASIAAAAAALLLSGNAFAASLQPAAGEGPFFNEQPVSTSSLQRAEVRQQTREAIAHGFRPAAGDA